MKKLGYILLLLYICYPRIVEPYSLIEPRPLTQRLNYNKSYAIVIAIDRYEQTGYSNLENAKKDAILFSDYLKKWGFITYEIYDDNATKNIIYSTVEDISKNLSANDRVLFYFSGHGESKSYLGEEKGYIIPYDGKLTDDLISMDEIRNFSEMLTIAKHQFFILDSCFSGMLLKHSGAKGIEDLSNPQPKYIERLTKREARQLVTAGGKKDRVPDGFFTKILLRALKDGKADYNKDGFIIASELSSYLSDDGTNYFATPVWGRFKNGGTGEYVFINPLGGSPRPNRGECYTILKGQIEKTPIPFDLSRFYRKEGDRLYSQGQYLKAKTKFQISYNIDDTNIYSLQMMEFSELKGAKKQYSTGKKLSLESLFDKYFNLASSNIYVNPILGREFLEKARKAVPLSDKNRKGNFEDLELLYNRMVGNKKITPKILDTLLKQAEGYYEKGVYQKAHDYYETILMQDPFLIKEKDLLPFVLLRLKDCKKSLSL